MTQNMSLISFGVNICCIFFLTLSLKKCSHVQSKKSIPCSRKRQLFSQIIVPFSHSAGVLNFSWNMATRNKDNIAPSPVNRCGHVTKFQPIGSFSFPISHWLKCRHHKESWSRRAVHSSARQRPGFRALHRTQPSARPGFLPLCYFINSF